MAKGLNLKELLLGDPVRIRYVVRFSTCHVIHKESVAEHSYYVALYAMFIADWVRNATDYRILTDVDTLLRRALLHDLEEAITGDVSRSFKYSDNELLQGLKRGAQIAIDRVLGRLDTGCGIFYRNIWRDCKDRSYEGSIIEFADFLSVLSYMIQERTNSNNSMQQHWETLNEYFINFDHERFSFLRPLIEDANTIMREAFSNG